MVVTNSQERPVAVVKRYTFPNTLNQDGATTNWVADPPRVSASRGDTVRWTVDDTSLNRQIEIRNVHGVFTNITCQGNVATATIKDDAVVGRHYVYRFFWGPDEAEGSSAPGVIIE